MMFQKELPAEGLTYRRVSRHRPFRIIKCALCGGTDFSTLEYAGVYCARCNTRYDVQNTAGDPGFIVRAHPETTWWKEARRWLPPGGSLHCSLVFKDSLDPEDMSTDRCRCEGGNPALTTSAHVSLRSGLHRCQIGTLYGWRVVGKVPSIGQVGKARTILTLYTTSEEIEGENWPGSLASTVHQLPPAIYPFNTLPPIADLEKGERWVLYRWDNQDEGDPSVVKPVWARVKIVYGEGKPKTLHNATGRVAEEVL